LVGQAENIPGVTKRQLRANLTAILVGVLATAAVVAAYVGGQLDWLELITLDLRYRYCNSIPQRPDIVCIDIDDSTLKSVGRWPWPRDKQAALVSIPAELGARAILVDLTWGGNESFRNDVPEDVDVVADPLDIDPEQAEKRWPDYELRAALAEAKNVYLAYEYPTRDPESSDEFNAAVDALDRGDEAAARHRLDALLARRRAQTGTDQDPDDKRLLQRAYMVEALEDDPTRSVEALAASLNLEPQPLLERYFGRCWIAALRRIARDWLDESPERWQENLWNLFPPLYAKLIKRAAEDAVPLRLRLALGMALRDVLGRAATTRNALVPLERVESIATHVDGVAPVYFFHARVARRCGFVVFEPDADGVVRRMPLFAKHAGDVLTQLAFTLACDELGVTPDGISVKGRTLRLRTPNGPRPDLTIQLDERGRALIPWVKERNWIRNQFTHLPAEAICSLHKHRRALEHNEALVLEALSAILANEQFAELAECRRTLADVVKLRADVRKARYRELDEEARLLSRCLDELRPEVENVELRVRARVKALQAQVAQPGGAAENGARRALQFSRGLLALVDECRRVNPELVADIKKDQGKIRGIVDGAICLIGYTASSLPDMKPIPTSRSAPGVMAHANMLNGLLLGRLVRWAPLPMNVVIAVALGLLITLISVTLRPRLSFWLVAFALVSYVSLAGAVAFYRYTYSIALTPAMAAMIFSFFFVAVHRYVFIEGERRHLATALGQYTSKEIARQVAENPELCRRAEMREVTAVFTDLKGFTTIAEQIGAERTQRVLNVCLGRFTRVMLHHEGMVNKFTGDGVFAFWNPVVYPQADHALRACEAAVDLIAALRALREEQRRRGGDEAFDWLVLRVGVATGNAIVGPCGSEQKYDYTCIGDSVNVASRLESANKVYGTQILISAGTRDQVGQAFELRPLGGVRVKGKAEAVPIYELLGRTGRVPPESIEYAHAFGEAVALFQRRQWRAALAAFEACRRRRPNDLAAQNYIEATAAFVAEPPGDDWSGALELQEK
jgi:adenylate cyclase